jgi:hydroxyethylthiazole kinase-like uncharacterized protein yjeF
MQKLFDEVNTLDKRCYDELGLSEDILMEHAANSMATFIQKRFEPHHTILIVCGSGNNGADGIALARLLHGAYRVYLMMAFEPKSSMAKLQIKRAQNIGVEVIEQLIACDVIVDCLFGTGLNRALDEFSNKIISKLNTFKGYKIACDIPSGLQSNGQIQSQCFKAHTTITMGALKTALFSDVAKDFVGEIKVASLGINKAFYEANTQQFLLEPLDVELPFRLTKNTNKGSFGHLAVIVGEKKGAGLLACEAAFAFGCSLISALNHEPLSLPYHIMQTHHLPKNSTAIAIGMGLGNYENQEIEQILKNDLPKIIDADLFYSSTIKCCLHQNNIVLTPHPKEFCALLKTCDIAHIDVQTLQQNRFKYALMFSAKYPNVVLHLKGANSIIAHKLQLYVNALGGAVLSKGGSGDVLSGLIGSLLAQGYTPLNAAISASLAHALAANAFEGNNYALMPQDIIQKVKTL